MHLLASRSGDSAQLCQIEGVRWLSSATLLYEAVSDLAGHSTQQQRALRDSLPAGTTRPPDSEPSAQLLHLCRAVAAWLEDEARDQLLG